MSNCVNTTTGDMQSLFSASKYFGRTRTWVMVITFLSVAVSCSTITLFVVQRVMLVKYIHLDNRRRLMADLLKLFPVMSFGASLAVMVPASIGIMKFVLPAYLMYTMISFHDFIAHLFGVNVSEMSQKLTTAGVTLNLATKPFCCCKCLPRVQPNSRNLIILSSLIYPAAFVQIVLTFAVFIRQINDGNFSGHSRDSTIENVMNIAKFVTTLFAMLAIFIFNDITNQVISARYRVSVILKMVQCLLLVVNIQGLIFEQLGNARVITTHTNLTDPMTAYIYHYILMIVEVALLSAFSTWYFRPLNCALFDNSPEAVEDTSNHNSVIHTNTVQLTEIELEKVKKVKSEKNIIENNNL